MAVTKRICSECHETFIVTDRAPDQKLCDSCLAAQAEAEQDMAAATDDIKKKLCEKCKKPYVPTSNNQKICPVCKVSKVVQKPLIDQAVEKLDRKVTASPCPCPDPEAADRYERVVNILKVAGIVSQQQLDAAMLLCQ